MEVMTSLPFLSAVALSTGKKEKKQTLEANGEFFYGNTKSFRGNGIVEVVNIGQQNRAKMLQFLEPSILTLINYFEHQKSLL